MAVTYGAYYNPATQQFANEIPYSSNIKVIDIPDEGPAYFALTGDGDWKRLYGGEFWDNQQAQEVSQYKPTPFANDPLTVAIYRGADAANFQSPYRDNVLQMVKAYAPIMGQSENTNWRDLFYKVQEQQYSKYRGWSTYDNPSQTFLKVIEWGNLPNADKVKAYVESTPQYKKEAESFSNAWNESNKSTGSLFNDLLTVGAIAVAFMFPQLSGFIGEAIGFGAATSASAIAAGNAVLAGGMAAVQGKSTSDILEAAAIGGVGSLAGGAASSAVGGGVPGAIASGATQGAIGAVAKGGDVKEAATTGGVTAGISSGIKSATATPGTAETVGTPTPGAPAPAAPGQEAGDFPAYSETGEPLTAEQTATKYADLYPEGRLPSEGESVAYSPGEKGVSVPSSVLAQIFNLGMRTPGAAPAGSAPTAPGSTSAQFGGGAGSAVEAIGGGDVESPESGGKRRNVWNVASLRNLQEGLGV